MPSNLIAPLLLPWYEQHGRKDLPWQLNKDGSGYKVWLSEIMLQQTQVATVIPYYERFLKRFPGFEQLASAELDEVLSLWAGLGYYARARNLHRCACEVMHNHGGCLPNDIDQLISLPGIGRSTAGAILSLAFDTPATILDGNVKRVLSRVFRIEGWAGQTAVQKELWRLAEQQTPTKQNGKYNQAMMDLGATMCRRSKPRCEDCPLTEICQSHRFEEQVLYPQPKPKKQRPKKHTWMLIHRRQGQVLLEKRPPSGIWGGLWSLPEIDHLKQLPDWQRKTFGRQLSPITTFDLTEKGLRHQFSHFDLDISTAIVDLPASDQQFLQVNELDSFCWIKLKKLADYGIPAPVMKLLLEMDLA